MIPAVVLLGGSSVYAARTWVQREVALRVDAQRQHDAASARPRDASTRFSTIVVAAKALPVGVELNRDAIYTRYPNLYEGATWLELVQQFNGEYLDWRLYRVLGGDADTTQSPQTSARR